LEILNDEFQVRHHHNPIHHIESRLKSIESMIVKLREKGLDLDFSTAQKNLFDIAGVRVVCCYVDDIYHVAEILLRQSDVELIRKKDYIQNPKPNGYRSLHLVIRIPVFLSEQTVMVPVEVQLRTVAMDFWASLEHPLRYKLRDEIPEGINEELLDCSNEIAAIDLRMQDMFRRIQNRGQKNNRQKKEPE
jgi:putative GTP pyrophosphokinase